MKAPPPFHPIDVTVNLDLCVRPIDDDPSVDVEVWNSQLVATPTPAPTNGDADAFDGDPEIPPIVIATSKSYRIDLPNTRYGALEAVTSLDADLAGYQVLLDGDATVFDAYYDILLVIADTTVDPDFRGFGYGPWLTAESINILGSSTTLVACTPFPSDIDAADAAGYGRRRTELIDLARRLGFEPFDDAVMVLKLDEIGFGDALASLRHVQEHGTCS